MKRTLLSLFCMLTCALTAMAQASFDTLEPFGFVKMSSRTDASKTYNFTAGGTFKATGGDATSTITLKSNGKPMDSEIRNAITSKKVIIFDGSDGDFILSSYISLQGISGKTLIGVNNARICTQWHVTEEITALLDAANVKSASTTSGGGTLSNGVTITEEAEFLTRKILLEKYGNENYRNSGCLYMKGCSNIAIRNIKFVGPGSIDCSGKDLLAFDGSKNMWVDHCEFTDGIDGNFDITNSSDFCTVSWCTFSYTDRSYMHQNTNLVGSSDSEATGYLNITFAYNVWGQKCRARMPMARVGKIHMLNNYYNCAGNATACINPRKNSEFLIEGNYFEANVSKVFSQTDAIAYEWKSSNYIGNKSTNAPASKGTVSVPYEYSVQDVMDMPTTLTQYAGATLPETVTAISMVNVERPRTSNATYNLSGQRVSPNAKGVIIQNGKKVVK